MRALTCSVIILGVLAEAPAFAQANRNQAPAKPAPAQPSPSQPATPAQAEPAKRTDAPLRTEQTKFDSWIVTCQEAVGVKDSKRCSAALQIINEQSKRVAFLWTMGKTAAGPASVFAVPTGVNLTKGLEVKFGKGQVRKITFTACDAGSCEALLPIDEGVVKEVRSGEEASVVMNTKDGQTVTFSIVNKGFEQALNAIRQ